MIKVIEANIALKGEIKPLFEFLEDAKNLNATHYNIITKKGEFFLEHLIQAYKQQSEREILEDKIEAMKKDLSEALQKLNNILNKNQNE